MMKIRSIPMPGSAWPIAVVVMLLWISRLLLFPDYIRRAIPHPPEGNAIDVPILINTVSTVVLFPLWCLCLWRALRCYPAHARWLAWNGERWGWSLFWTFLCVVGVCASFVSLEETAELRLPLNTIANALWIVAWIVLRAVIVSRLRPRTGAPNHASEATSGPAPSAASSSLQG
jgi:hypothetical protein